jgi:hypothetical protein
METWKFINNQFVNATNGNFKKALILSNYHAAALDTRRIIVPAYEPIYERYLPLHQQLVLLYNTWRSAGGAQQGQTLGLEQQFINANNLLDDWDLGVQIIYKKTTPQYKAIFPDGRKPFRQGSLDQRINAFDTLALNMGTDPALATIKGQVLDTYETLDNTRESQQGAKSTLKGGSTEVDTARTAAMNMQYRNLGFIMDTFFETRETECNMLFDLSTLRESEQSSFTATLDPEETEAILVHHFLTSDQLRCRIDTDGPISLYLASSPGATDSTAAILSSPAEVLVPLSAFGPVDLNVHRYLTAVSSAGNITKLRVVLD